MRKNGDYPGGAKVYESKKEKKRRLVMNSDSESEEFVITPRVEILHTGNGAASGRRNKVLEKGGGREKMVTRGEELRRKLGNEGSKGKVIEAMSDRKSREIGVDQSDVGDIKSGYVDSVGNQTDTIGGSSKSSVSLKLSYKFTGSANEKVLESKSGRKRSMETGDDEFSRKKTKAENMDSVDNDTEKSGEGDKSLTIVKHGDKIMDSRTDGVQVSKLPVPRAKQRDEDGSSERDFQPSLKTSSKAEAVRWLGQSGQREPQKVKDARFSDAKKEEDGGSSQHSYIRMRGKSGVLRVLQGSRKDGSENSYVQCKGQGKTKRLGSSGTNRFSISNHQLERQVDEKSISNIKLGKRASKVSSEDASKSSVSKVNQETTSQKKVSTNMDLSHSKSGLAAKEKKNTKELNESRSTVKNKIREQIKNILLDAGWRIEFRPRRGRDYEDAVYVSPQGSGYWSITKAYDIYVRQFQSTCDDKESSGKQPKASAERDGDKEANSTYVVIPPEVLLMLKRNVVNKRRRRNEMEDVKRKVRVGRRKKKDKEIAKVKRPKDKGTRNDVGGTRAITRKVTVRNSKRGGCALMVRGSNQDKGSEKGDYAPYVWKRTVLSWMIDLGVLPVYGKVRYMNKRMTRALLDGRLTRDGIQCSCCSKILTVSKFETHAGSKLHQPYENIYLEVSGMSEISLLQCQINAWEKQESKRSNFYDVDTDGDDPNDDTCGICGDGGDLICCDSCPSTFHLCCLGIEMLPTGDWHCTNCSCKFCGSVHDSASQDRNASNALFTCSQCARKYHKDCVPEGDTVVPNSSCNVFCGRSCRKVFRKLQKLSGARNELEPGFYWSIIRRFDEPSKSPSRMTQRVECNSKIAVAYTVMDECFVPITDQRSGINLIHNVVYNCGSNFNRVNFSGFYTFILERGDEVIAAASVRIHDTRVAEMPFIGTRSMYRRQGMCRRLLKGIESALRSLCIRKLIIPAISELTDTWTTVFGFKPLGISQKQELKSVNILVFPGTGLLQKSLLKDSTKKHTNPEPEKNPETQISVKADKSYSPDEVMDSKKSKRDAEAIKPNIPALEHSTNFFPEASGCHAQFYRSSDSAADGESNDLKSVVSFNNHVEKDLSLGNCSNEVVACIEEPKKELVEVTDVLPSFHYPASELLLHGTSGIEALEFRYSQNESNSELPVTDVVENCSSAKEGECPLASLQRLEDKPPSNGIAREVSPKKCEFIEADEDRTHDVNAVKLRHDANGQESNVTEESIEVSVGVIRASELLHGASGIEALELRPPQNEYNSELPVTDVVSYCNSEKEGECRLGSLPKLKDKHPNNGIEHVVSPKKCEFIEAGEDRAHAINELTLRNDADGLESNVNDESIELSVDIIGHLNTPGKGSCVSSGVCGNGSRVNSEYYSVASNERTSQEKSELLQYQVKCYVEANDSAPLDRLAVSNSATRLEVEGVSGIVGANSATSEGLLSKLKESTPCINQNFPSIGEVGDDCHDDVCDVSIAENDVGVVEYVHGFELSSVNQASKMVT